MPGCDVFHVAGKKLCGPALIVPAWAKCGTNAFKEYTALHPLVKWPEQSEVMFDPAMMSPYEFVAKYNPGVTPSDPHVWMAKGNFAMLDGSVADPLQTALALRRAFPSARIVLTLCDPITLPFRWYRHTVERALVLRASGRTVSAAAVQSALRKQVAQGRGLTLRDLFHAIFPPRGGCMRTRKEGRLLATFGNRFALGMPAWAASQGRHPDFTNASACERFRGSGLPAGWRAMPESEAWAGGRYNIWPSHPAAYIRRWLAAGYELNSTLTVVVMERWKEAGPDLLTRVFRMLGLQTWWYPFDRVGDFRPVYSVSAASGGARPLGPNSTRLTQNELARLGLDSLVPLPELVPVVAAGCHATQQLIGQPLTWPACSALRAEPTPPAVNTY